MKKISSLFYPGIQIILLSSLIFLSSCTTQDFEAPDANNDVYRLKIENTSDRDIRYSPEVSLFYIDGKENLDLADSTISPNEPAHIITESEEGTFGFSADVRVRPSQTTARLILEIGTGRGDNFELDEVVRMNEGGFIVFVRHGEIY